MTRLTLRAALLAGACFALALPATAHETADAPRKTEYFQPGAAHAGTLGDNDGPVPFYTGLGDIAMAVTTTSADAQRYVDQGLALAWGFNHAEARRSFRAAQALDPSCAMCFWGEALVLGPNINDGMAAAAVRPAWVAMSRAQALAETASSKEQALIAALAARYGANAMANRGQLDHAYAEAMREVARAYPDDPHVLALAAEALMDLQPWDYWEADGVTPKGAAVEIVAALEAALAIDPDHVGAAHLYIHAVEASADPSRAEAVADRLAATVTGTGHLAHMPAHIYARVGRHHDSIEANRAAIAADEAFLDAAGSAASDLYRYGYYPHNVHFLMVSAQMSGLGSEAIAAARKLVAITSDEVAGGIAWIQAIQTAPFTAHAQFSDPATILALPETAAGFPFVEGFRRYARGVAHVTAGDLVAAEAEIAAIDRLIETADFAGLEAQYLPARELLTIARTVVGARLATARGDLGEAEALLREAVAREDGLGYMEPPYWYYPVRQTLGAVLLMQGRADEAAETFEAALTAMPRNGWALWGLWQAQNALGVPEAAATAAVFEAVWIGDAHLLRLDRL